MKLVLTIGIKQSRNGFFEVSITGYPKQVFLTVGECQDWIREHIETYFE